MGGECILGIFDFYISYSLGRWLFIHTKWDLPSIFAETFWEDPRSIQYLSIFLFFSYHTQYFNHLVYFDRGVIGKGELVADTFNDRLFIFYFARFPPEEVITFVMIEFFLSPST